MVANRDFGGVNIRYIRGFAFCRSWIAHVIVWKKYARAGSHQDYYVLDYTSKCNHTDSDHPRSISAPSTQSRTDRPPPRATHLPGQLTMKVLK